MDSEMILGNCFDILPALPPKSADMILTDPPYGITRAEWDAKIDLDGMWRQFERVIKDDGAVLVFGAEPFSSYLRIANIRHYRYDWVWDKVHGTGFLNANRQPMRHAENISVFYRRQPAYHPQMTHGHERKASRRRGTGTELYGKAAGEVFYDSTDRYPGNILRFSKDTQKSSLHPAQKPVALLEYLIRTYTDPGGLVLDPFAGAMSTAAAAKNTGRRYLCVEKDGRMFEAGKARVKREGPQ